MTTTERLGFPASRWRLARWIALLATVCSAGTTLAQPVPQRQVLPSSVWLLTAQQQLLQVNAQQPSKTLQVRAIRGLLPNDSLVGIDYRVARGTLFGLGRSGTLYRLVPSTGQADAVGRSAVPEGLSDVATGFDFNPVADRIRVVTASGRNLRLHPDTGALASADPPLAFAPDDANAGRAPRVTAAAYTYNAKDDTLTTNYAIDSGLGALVTQGSKEGASPVVSPNLGVLRHVASLGTGPLHDVSFDISDVGNVALAVWQTSTTTLPRLYRIDLETGTPTLLGTVGAGASVIGLAIEP